MLKEKEGVKQSAIEEATKKLITDIIDDVRNQVLTKDNDLDGYLLGLELIANLYHAFSNWDVDQICGIEYAYRNNSIYEFHEYLNK